jgi:MFS family permease
MATISAPRPSAPSEGVPGVSTSELASIRRRTMGILFASQIFGSGSTAVALAVATILAADILGASTWAGLPNSVRILGAALFAVPLSSLMMRSGRRAGLALGYGIGAIGAALSVASAVLMDFGLLLLASLVFGGGFAANLLIRYAAADVSRASERAKAISFVVWGATVGAVVGPTMIGPAANWVAPIGLPPIAGAFVAGTVTFLIAAAILAVLLRPDPLAISRIVAASDVDLQNAAPPRPFGELVRLPDVQVALVTLMCSNVVMIAIMAMTPVYMHEHGHALTLVGIVVSAHVIGMYVFSPATGWLADRIGRMPVIVMSALVFLAAAALNAVAPASSGPLIALGMFLIGLGWNLGFVAGSTLLTDAVDLAERPRLQGIADSWMGIAAAIGSLASGPLHAGYGFAVLNFAIVATVVFPLIAIAWRRLQPAAVAPR